MSLNYKDFFPTVLKSGFFSTTHEELPATVGRASKWIEAAGVCVINVETVVLPNIQGVEEAFARMSRGEVLRSVVVF